MACKYSFSALCFFIMKNSVILVSACLMGKYTRYDGGTKYFPELLQYAPDTATFCPICPEVECGLPIPREPMNLYLEAGTIYLKGVKSGRDFSPLMQDFLDKYVLTYGKTKVCGFILKARSPSCGIWDTPLYAADTNEILQRGGGLFARFIRQHYPELPLISDEDFLMPEKREEFWAKAEKQALEVLGRQTPL